MTPEALAMIVKLMQRKTKPTWKYVSKMVGEPLSTCWSHYQKHLENMAVTTDQNSVPQQRKVVSNG